LGSDPEVRCGRKTLSQGEPLKHSRTSETRFSLNEPLTVITRPYGMRFYTFWMEMLNLNHKRFLLRALNNGFVPYHVGTHIHATVDLRGKIFDRPLHFVLGIEKTLTHQGMQAFDVVVMEIIGNHSHIFEKGMSVLDANLNEEEKRDLNAIY
jgi:hypothetical protein